jgi:hypothetical protein
MHSPPEHGYTGMYPTLQLFVKHVHSVKQMGRVAGLCAADAQCILLMMMNNDVCQLSVSRLVADPGMCLADLGVIHFHLWAKGINGTAYTYVETWIFVSLPCIALQRL